MEKKKRNNKYICCFFTIWKLKSRLTDKSGQVVLSRTSVYFVSVISYCHFYILFMHHALSFPTFIFTLNVPRFPFYLIDRNRQQVLLIKWAIIFLRLKFFFCSFELFENGHIHVSVFIKLRTYIFSSS